MEQTGFFNSKLSCSFIVNTVLRGSRKDHLTTTLGPLKDGRNLSYKIQFLKKGGMMSIHIRRSPQHSTSVYCRCFVWPSISITCGGTIIRLYRKSSAYHLRVNGVQSRSRLSLGKANDQVSTRPGQCSWFRPLPSSRQAQVHPCSRGIA